MVSGHGVRGGRGRCFTLWRDFMKCAEAHGTYGPNVCHDQRADYMECLHRSKLATRLDTIEEQKKKLIREGKWPPNEKK